MMREQKDNYEILDYEYVTPNTAIIRCKSKTNVITNILKYKLGSKYMCRSCSNSDLLKFLGKFLTDLEMIKFSNPIIVAEVSDKILLIQSLFEEPIAISTIEMQEYFAEDVLGLYEKLAVGICAS